MRTRFYNPVIGRFTQEDTYRGDGLNLYAYCGNNPVGYFDPSGYSSLNKERTLASLAPNENIVYRALNAKDAERFSQGLGLEAKNPLGTGALDDHLVSGSGKRSWVNDPFISTTTDINVARGFNQSGSKLGIVEIDLNKVPSEALRGYEIYPRVNGAEGLPYHYSVWQQETSVYQSIPKEAIKGVVK